VPIHRGAAGQGIRLQAGHRVSALDLGREVAECVDLRSRPITDEFTSYKSSGKLIASSSIWIRKKP